MFDPIGWCFEKTLMSFERRQLAKAAAADVARWRTIEAHISNGKLEHALYEAGKLSGASTAIYNDVRTRTNARRLEMQRSWGMLSSLQKAAAFRVGLPKGAFNRRPDHAQQRSPRPEFSPR